MNIAQAQAIKTTRELAEALLVRLDHLSKRVAGLEAREGDRALAKLREQRNLSLPKANK